MIENLDLFFSDFFAVDAALENGSTIKIIFDEEHDALSLGAEGRSIIATAKTGDVNSLHHGDSLTLNNLAYKVVGIRPIMDGKITELDLSL